MDAQRHMVVSELDLSACGPASIVDKINAVPALKTSTAFFTFLRANLALNPSTISQTNTPVLEPTIVFPTHPAPTPSPPASTTPSAALLDDDDIPPLSLEVLHDDASKASALRLVADSISQQRPQAALSLALHPVCASGLAASLALGYRYLRADPAAALATCIALLSLCALALHRLTAGYRRLAADVVPALTPRATDRDTILGARLNGRIVGALVLRLEPGPAHGHSHGNGRRRAGRHAPSLRGGRGVIRAWTTAAGSRDAGVGREMLARAARLTREKCGGEAAVGFARDHANSAAVLPEMFNGGLRRRERRAARALEGVLAGLDGGKKKKKR